MTTVLIPITLGFFFGFALQKAGFGHYDKIINQFRFKDNTMMKFMLTAICVGMVCIYGLKDMGLITLTTVNETYVAGNLVGGLIFGIGMAIAGTCPGTIFAGIGQGNLDYLIPGFLGFLTGGLIFGASYESFFLKIYSIARYETQTLEDLFQINHWLFISVMVAGTLAFYIISKKQARALSLRPDVKKESETL